MAISEVLVAERRTLRVPMPASLAVAVGDLCWWDDSANVGKPATQRSDTGSKAGNQLDFTPLFLGVSADQRLAAETAVTGSSAPTGPGDRLIVPDGIFDCACASATFEFGDLVGIDRDATPLNTNQQVIGVAARNLAIGFVVKREPAAVTKVRCYLSAYSFGWFPARGGGTIGVGVIAGSGAPTSVSAAKGTLYVNTTATTTTTRIYVNTDGGTTWATFTASA